MPREALRMVRLCAWTDACGGSAAYMRAKFRVEWFWRVFAAKRGGAA